MFLVVIYHDCHILYGDYQAKCTPLVKKKIDFHLTNYHTQYIPTHWKIAAFVPWVIL
jgi:hypothetical protein